MPDVIEVVLFILAIVALVVLFLGMRFVSRYARTLRSGTKCPSCGRRLDGSFIVCPYCGEPIDVKDR